MSRILAWSILLQFAQSCQYISPLQLTQLAVGSCGVVAVFTPGGLKECQKAQDCHVRVQQAHELYAQANRTNASQPNYWCVNALQHRAHPVMRSIRQELDPLNSRQLLLQSAGSRFLQPGQAVYLQVPVHLSVATSAHLCRGRCYYCVVGRCYICCLRTRRVTALLLHTMHNSLTAFVVMPTRCPRVVGGNPVY